MEKYDGGYSSVLEPLTEDEKEEVYVLNQIINNLSEKDIAGIRPDPKLTNGLLQRYRKLHKRRR